MATFKVKPEKHHGEHVTVRVFANGASAGLLTLRSEEAAELVLTLHGDGAAQRAGAFGVLAAEAAISFELGDAALEEAGEEEAAISFELGEVVATFANGADALAYRRELEGRGELACITGGVDLPYAVRKRSAGALKRRGNDGG